MKIAELLNEAAKPKFASVDALANHLYPNGGADNTADVWMSKPKWAQLLKLANAGAKIMIKYVLGQGTSNKAAVQAMIEKVEAKGYKLHAKSSFAPEDERTELLFTKV
jgi:hypothetical protein